MGCVHFLEKIMISKAIGKPGKAEVISVFMQNVTDIQIILEFKYTKDEKDDLEKLAEKALEQIKEKQYDAEMTGEVCYIGLAHCGKKVTVHSTCDQQRISPF